MMNAFKSNPDKPLTPDFITAGPFTILGITEHLDDCSAQKIPNLWNKLMQDYWNKIPGSVNDVGYGLCIDLDKGNCIYLAGREVNEIQSIPDFLQVFVLPSQTYAVFKHSESVMQIRQTINNIFNQWLPSSGYQLTSTDKNRLVFFERYGEEFNPDTGKGGIEIWLPIR
jgi:AraC family transcriptional regulator